MFPSTAHGGGLRLFDILGHLSQRNQIDLYSVYREDLDAASLAHIVEVREGILRALAAETND